MLKLVSKPEGLIWIGSFGLCACAIWIYYVPFFPAPQPTSSWQTGAFLISAGITVAGAFGERQRRGAN